MSYAKKNLSQGERVIYTTSLHWILFFESVCYLITGLAISYLAASYKDYLKGASTFVAYIGIGFLVYGGIKFLVELVRLRSSQFVVTSSRVIIRVGVLQKKSLAMPLSKIESIEVDQSILGQMLGFGTIHVTGTGTAESKFDYISNPSQFRRKLQIATSGDSNSEETPSSQSKLEQVRRRKRRRR
jgi:membrane protein YdbS with pleckstrin-like domain